MKFFIKLSQIFLILAFLTSCKKAVNKEDFIDLSMEDDEDVGHFKNHRP